MLYLCRGLGAGGEGEGANGVSTNGMSSSRHDVREINEDVRCWLLSQLEGSGALVEFASDA